MDYPLVDAKSRIEARALLLRAIDRASRRRGASAFHLLGSLGRDEADAFSDIDAWLTFPDDAIDAAVRRRLDFYREAGDLLLMHEAAGNRPRGGMYTLALYQTTAGPMQVDWYLAPQRTSRVAPEAAVVYAQAPVPHGVWLLETESSQDESLAERVSWLTCMLFVAIKVKARGGEPKFLAFLGDAYREVQETYRLGAMPVTDSTTLSSVGDMLRQLAPFANETQRRAIHSVEAFAAAISRGTPR